MSILNSFASKSLPLNYVSVRWINSFIHFIFLLISLSCIQITLYLICVQRTAIFGNSIAPTSKRQHIKLCMCLLSYIWQLFWIFGRDTHNIRTLSLKIKMHLYPFWNWPEKITKEGLSLSKVGTNKVYIFRQCAYLIMW